MNVEQQRLEALRVANHHRVVIAAKKKEIAGMDWRAAHRAAADLIETTDDPALLAGRVAQYLGAIPRRGPQFISQTFRVAGLIARDRRLRELTGRQREVIAAYLRGDE